MENGQTEKKLLVLDIDGTLTNSKKEITTATREAIQDLLVRGHKVVLASGRPTPGMRKCEKELELERYGGYLLSFNGAHIMECRSGEVVYQKPLPLTLLPGLYKFARDNGCGLVTYLGEQMISAFPMDEYIEINARINGLSIRHVENFLDFVDFSINKCLMTALPEKAQFLERQLQEKLGSVASIYRSEPYFIEIMSQNVTKATGLERILEVLGMKRENMVCCGDSFNDIAMIRYAGVGVAMGNAQPAVKEAADYITDTNDRDGVVEVIRKFFS